MPATPPTRRTERRTYRHTAPAIGAALVMALAIAAMLVLGLVADPAPPAGPAPWWARALIVAASLVALVVLLQAARARLDVDDDGVTVRNGFGSRRLAWDDIAAFTIVERVADFTAAELRADFGAELGGRVRLRDGSSVPVDVLTPTRHARAFGGRAVAYRRVDELNDLLRARQHPGDRPG